MTNRPLYSFLLSATALACLVAESVRGQELVLRKVAELSSEAASFAPSTYPSVIRLDDGSYVVSPLFTAPSLVRYRADGSVLEVYNRTGEGPGEFTRAPRLAPGVVSGEFLAVDEDRLMIFTNDFEHLETKRLPMRVRSTFGQLADGSIVIDNRQVLGDSLVWAHVIAEGSSAITSFGSVAAPDRTKVAVSILDNQRIATSYIGGSTVHVFDSQGENIETIDVGRDWFEPWMGRLDGDQIEGRTVPFRPRISGVSIPSPDHILVLTMVQDSEWVADSRTGEIPIVPSEMDYSGDWDSVLELVDRNTGQVVAVIRSDEALVPISGVPNGFHSTRVTSIGHVLVDIWEVTAAR